MDDERANDGIGYIIVGLASLVLAAIVLASMVIVPAFAAGLVLRGHHPLMRLLGIALFGGWLVLLWRVGRRVMAPRPTA